MHQIVVVRVASGSYPWQHVRVGVSVYLEFSNFAGLSPRGHIHIGIDGMPALRVPVAVGLLVFLHQLLRGILLAASVLIRSLLSGQVARHLGRYVVQLAYLAF